MGNVGQLKSRIVIPTLPMLVDHPDNARFSYLQTITTLKYNMKTCRRTTFLAKSSYVSGPCSGDFLLVIKQDQGRQYFYICRTERMLLLIQHVQSPTA